MAERKKLWYDLNDGRGGTRVPFIFETWTFDRDFLPKHVFKCTSETGRKIEYQLLSNIRNYELLNDDKVMPDYFSIHWFTQINEFGFKVEVDYVPDSEGVVTGYAFKHPITDLSRDLELLKPATCKVDREKTYRYRDFLRELFGDYLDVRIDNNMFHVSFLTQKIVTLMGMEAFFMAMIEEPDKVHQLMAYLRDNCLRIWNWAEKEGLLRPNHGNQPSFGSSFNFTNNLSPNAQPSADAPAKISDIFGAFSSQETVGISPEMFHEFCFPYYLELAKPLGLLYYGCCEPIQTFWDDIARYPHLKKVSMNRWCDQFSIGERLRGTNVVFSRKPDPNLIGVDKVLNEDAWRAHIAETLQAARNVQLEMIMRDVYTVHGNLDKPRRAIQIAREEIAKAGRS